MDPPLKVHIHTLKNFVPSPKDDFLTQFLIFGSVLAILAKMGNFGKIGGPPPRFGLSPLWTPPVTPLKFKLAPGPPLKKSLPTWTPPKNLRGGTELDPLLGFEREYVCLMLYIYQGGFCLKNILESNQMLNHGCIWTNYSPILNLSFLALKN